MDLEFELEHAHISEIKKIAQEGKLVIGKAEKEAVQAGYVNMVGFFCFGSGLETCAYFDPIQKIEEGQENCGICINNTRLYVKRFSEFRDLTGVSPTSETKEEMYGKLVESILKGLHSRWKVDDERGIIAVNTFFGAATSSESIEKLARAIFIQHATAQLFPYASLHFAKLGFNEFNYSPGFEGDIRQTWGDVQRYVKILRLQPDDEVYRNSVKDVLKIEL